MIRVVIESILLVYFTVLTTILTVIAIDGPVTKALTFLLISNFIGLVYFAGIYFKNLYLNWRYVVYSATIPILILATVFVIR